MRQLLDGPARVLAVLLAGGILGALIGGVGGRVVMYLLIRLSPAADGVTSDDGFEMGRFTLSGSLNLVGVGMALGLVGAVLYLLVRWLLFGPWWFRVLSVTLASGVGVGNIIVHTDGVDFSLLQPALVSVLAFVAVPAAYGAALTVVAERRILAAWPVPPPTGAVGSATLWVLRAVALAVGVLSLVDLVGKTAVVA
ncbi:PE-PGRS family protein [Nocardioidaceae bacterium Broad-1]|nr:PE-PGRS family protein [Nocardioidaceae bacterium Broad-1]